jgi:glycosyltransferase involved in cell wall biosynthesis
MNVAILAPIAWRTPPRHYGPWEQVASNVAEGLVKAGVNVTLFATADSLTAGILDAAVANGYEEKPGQDAKVAECLHISNLMEKSASFDIIHNHFDFLPLSWSMLTSTPMITTIHGFSSPLILPVFQKYNDTTDFVSISNADRSPLLNYAGTVYNGINTTDFDFCGKPEDYLLFFGRIHPHKGTAEAIRIAQSSNKQLIIAGIIQDKAYFNSEVEPFLNDQIVYIGTAGPEQRNELLGQASALLHPISFDEPFGLSVAEAMLCGTPVIAFNRGAMPELIQPCKTGFLVENVEQAVAAVQQVKNIDRAYCREWSSFMFSLEKMASEYLMLYEKILDRRWGRS